MTRSESDDQFGCKRCWPVSGDDPHEAAQHLETEAELIDESHFQAAVCVCPTCAPK